MNKKLLVLLIGLFLLPVKASCDGWTEALTWIVKRAGVTSASNQSTKILFSDLAKSSLLSTRELVPLTHTLGANMAVDNVKNRITHDFIKSNLYTKQEKEVLKVVPPFNQSRGDRLMSIDGDVAIVPIARALYLEQFSAQVMSELSRRVELTPDDLVAFHLHQEKLQNFIEDMERNWSGRLGQTTFQNSVEIYSSQMGGRVALDIMRGDNGRITNLLEAGGGDKASFLLAKAEGKEFAALTLEEQKNYARRKYHESAEVVLFFLRKGPENMTNGEFKQFYIWRSRAEYFRNLSLMLDQAEAPLNSIIIRMKRPAKVPGMKAGNSLDKLELLDDAQRLGQLQFFADLAQPLSKEYIEISTELAHQKGLYETYAFGKTFGIPYERVPYLGEGEFSSSKQIEMMFGTKTMEKIENMSPKDKVKSLISVIGKITDRQAQLRKSVNADFAEYYRLSREKETYQNLLKIFRKQLPKD